MSDPIKLSASKIKTLQSCSWLYYCQYVIKLPKTSNAGASRGTVAHLVFETFVKERHKKHYDAVLEGGIAGSPAVARMVKKHAAKLGVDDPENMKMINDMVVLGLKQDFFCEGAQKVEAEAEFLLQDPHYLINGFIDKQAVYDDKIQIWDYKTSKSKFTPEEMDGNMQVLMYSLACYKTLGVIPNVSFLFLRFPKEPTQHAGKVNVSQLKGFESYLKYIGKYLSTFTEEHAKTDYAANDKKRMWMCGFNKFPGQLKKNGEVMWGCGYKFPFEYYAIIDAAGKLVKTAYTEEELKPKEGEKVEKKFYAGCPRFGWLHKNRLADW